MKRKILRVSDAALLHLLTDGEHHFRANGLPRDARVTSLFAEPAAGVVGLVVEHDSFPDVAEGDLDEADFTITVTTLDEPMLGLATTQQLLDELVARCEIDATIGEDRTLALDSLRILGEILPAEALEYRTVDS